MKAKQMFEALGFIEWQNDKTFIVYKNTSEPESIVSFRIPRRTYNVSQFYKEEEMYVWKSVGMALHKAITQQLKELGWLND